MDRISEKTIISAPVATAQRDHLARLAAANERSLSGEVRRALDSYLRLAGPYEDAGGLSSSSLPPAADPAERVETSEDLVRQSSSTPLAGQ